MAGGPRHIVTLSRPFRACRARPRPTLRSPHAGPAVPARFLRRPAKMRHDPMDLLRARATRRQFLAQAAGLVAMGTLGARRGDATLRRAAYPFTLGVAS